MQGGQKAGGIVPFGGVRCQHAYASKPHCFGILDFENAHCFGILDFENAQCKRQCATPALDPDTMHPVPLCNPGKEQPLQILKKEQMNCATPNKAEGLS
jgi:hypothetical protein